MAAERTTKGTDPGCPPIENHHGLPIGTLAEWRDLAPPTSPQHWRRHRSAFELASAWISGDAPGQLHALLAPCAPFAGMHLGRAIAERKTWFDDIPGGPRHHDLLVLGRAGAGPFVIGVEAKADEAFDRDLAGYVAAAHRRARPTRAPERLDRLTRAFFAATLRDDPSLAPLRYQLLAALAGTLAEADASRAAVAALVVHEFVTPLTDPQRQRRNAADLDAFVRRLGVERAAAQHDGSWLAGPFRIPGGPRLPARIPFYVGKLVTIVDGGAEGTPRPPRGAHGPGRPAGSPPVASGPIHRVGNPRAAGGQNHRVSLDIPAGTTVIKVNVHPPACRCGCFSRGALPFMANRPGDGLRPLRKPTAEDAVGQVRAWAVEAVRGTVTTPRARQSDFELRTGMTTLTLTVEAAGPAPRFVVRNWTAMEQHATEDLEAALAHLESWCRAAAPVAVGSGGRRASASPRSARRTTTQETTQQDGAPFQEWTRRWLDLAKYHGRSVPDEERRIADVIRLWYTPIPPGWQRGEDKRLLDPDRRYTRGNGGPGAIRRGEHAIEYEVLASDATDCLGGRLIDGVNAVPLARDSGGGRVGNVEADLLLLSREEEAHRLVLAEVKGDSDNAWYAAVENLRQLKLFSLSSVAQGIFRTRLPAAGLPEVLPVTAAVIAPSGFYAAAGAKAAAVEPAERLLATIRLATGVDACLATWDPVTRTIARRDGA